MKVLEQIQNVMVRDIPKFVDWLKTVRVEYHGDRGNRKYLSVWNPSYLYFYSLISCSERDFGVMGIQKCGMR